MFFVSQRPRVYAGRNGAGTVPAAEPMSPRSGLWQVTHVATPDRFIEWMFTAVPWHVWHFASVTTSWLTTAPPPGTKSR
jgi:hypothetical protein